MIGSFTPFEERYENIKKSDEHYYKIISNLIQLLNILNISDINEIFYALSYIKADGFLSVNQKYKYVKNNVYDFYLNDSEFGKHIMFGYGVCRHESMFLCDVFKKLNLNAEYIALHISKKRFEFPKTNHASVLCEYNENILLYDLTNYVISQVLKRRKVCSYTKGAKYTLTNFENISTSILNKKPILTFEEVERIDNYIYELLVRNIKLIHEFYISSKKDIDEVVKLVLKRKNIWNLY